MIDVDRVGRSLRTGIHVRARGVNGRYRTCDIGELDRDSLLNWLCSRGGSNVWAEDVVGILLGHGPLHDIPELTG